MTRFADGVYAHRLRTVARSATDAGFDAVVVTPGTDFEYLIGSRAESFERLTCLALDARAATATVVVPRLELAALHDSAVPGLGLPVVDWVDGESPHSVVAELLGRDCAMAISSATPALHVIPLAERVGRLPALATDVIASARMLKDDSEIAALREAGAAIDRVHAQVHRWLRPGRTETEVAHDISVAIVAEGHAEATFVIVGSGPNGADPHHLAGDRVIERGDTVVVDIGGRLANGYNSDCTRTYHLGPADSTVLQQYSMLEQAQAAAVAAIRPGVRAEDVDRAARDVLAHAGLGDHFIHRTGHGIGLSVHEEPYIVSGNATALQPGMAFSVEPGIYFPGQWGARIEDIVVVTDDGVGTLNRGPRNLQVL